MDSYVTPQTLVMSLNAETAQQDPNQTSLANIFAMNTVSGVNTLVAGTHPAEARSDCTSKGLVSRVSRPITNAREASVPQQQESQPVQEKKVPPSSMLGHLKATMSQQNHNAVKTYCLSSTYAHRLNQPQLSKAFNQLYRINKGDEHYI